MRKEKENQNNGNQLRMKFNEMIHKANELVIRKPVANPLPLSIPDTPLS